MVIRLFLCYNYYWLSPTTFITVTNHLCPHYHFPPDPIMSTLPFVTITNRKCPLYLNVHYTLSPTIYVHITVFPLTLTPLPATNRFCGGVAVFVNYTTGTARCRIRHFAPVQDAV